MKIGIIRDQFANPTDAMTFQEIEGVAMYGRVSELVGRLPYLQYDTVEDVPDDLDIYDVAELYHEWSWYFASRFPERTWVTVWDNIEDFAFQVNPHITQSVLRAPVAGFIARTMRTGDMLVNHYGIDPAKVYVVPAAVDDELFLPIVKPPFSGEKLVIGYAGRLTWEKGITRLVHAMRYLQNAKLIVAGDGPLKDWLVKFCGMAKIDLDYRGSIPHYEMPQFFYETDIFIYPSIPTPVWVEQFGVAAFEAVFCGIPTIVGATGAYLEYPGLFNLVAPEDVHSLIKAIHLVSSGKGRQVDRSWLTPLTSKAVGSQLTQIYAGKGSQWQISNLISVAG